MIRAVAALLVLLLLGRAAAGAQTAAGYQPSDCWFADAEPLRASCGHLIVPEQWEGATKVTLRLPLVRFGSKNYDSLRPPVVFLAGGPGSGSVVEDLDWLRAWRWYADSLFPGRVLIAFDQRGSGASEPALLCPGSDDPRNWAGLANSMAESVDRSRRYRDFLAACSERLKNLGIDFSVYNSRQIAMDVVALLDGLGFEKAVLFGNSYGTHLALTVLRAAPERVAGLVLDSVLPPGIQSRFLSGGPFGEALEALFQACAADEACNKAFPGLRGELKAVVARLAGSPLKLEVVNPNSTKPFIFQVDDWAFLDLLHRALYDDKRIPHLPSLIHGLAKGEDWRLKSAAEDFIYDPGLLGYREGANYAIACHDLFRGTDLERGVQASGAGPHLKSWARRVRAEMPCDLWPSGTASAELRAPVQGQVPALLLVGAFDPITPPSFARFAAATLSGSHLFVFPSEGHSPIWRNGCAHAVVKAFMEDPGPRPAPPCLDKLRVRRFSTLGGG